MPENSADFGLTNFARNSNILLTTGIVIILGVMILPVPTFFIDMLLNRRRKFIYQY
jgi:flagellar biosynthesis component FlhA